MSKEQTKQTAPIAGAVKTTTTTTAKVKDLLCYLLAVVCATAFFAHEFVPDKTQKEISLRQTWQQEKVKRTKLLNSLKQSTEGTAAYDKYLKQKEATDNAYNALSAVKNEKRFNGFKSFQQFLGEFGWAFGLLLYAIFNLSRVNSFKDDKGLVILHTTLIFIALYFITWCVSPSHVQDFEKPTYLIYSLFASLSVLLGMYVVVEKRNRYINKLLLDIRNLVGYGIEITPEDREDELFNVLEGVSND